MARIRSGALWAAGELIKDLSFMRQFGFLEFFARTFCVRPLGALPAVVLALAGGIATVQDAEARRQSQYQIQYQYQNHPRSHHRRRMERDTSRKAGPDRKAEAEQHKPSGPLYAVVSLTDQHISFYDANGLWARSVVSTGVNGHPTPTGIFSILEKERWHRSNIYSGAPMPYMQRLAWTGVAMHEGVVTGRPASHGCIRLPGAFAKRLFAVTNVGQRVIIAPEDVAPSDIAHAHLPVPRLLPAPEAPEAQIEAKTGKKPVETVALDKQAAGAARGGLLNPSEYAQALKAAAASRAVAAVKAEKVAIALLSNTLDEGRQAARELYTAEESLRRAKAELEDSERSLVKAQGEEPLRKATERKAAAEGKLVEAEARVQTARDAKAAKDQNVLSEQAAIKDAEAQAAAAAASAKDAAVRAEPISIFISRKTRHLYVRQATQHLFDVPIAIRDPERPLGSHLFIATRAGDDGASLRWVGLTPPAAVEVKLRRHSSRRGRRIEPEEDASPMKPFPETAAAALDRIEIPPEAAQRIADRLWTGATLIISDVGMSGEGRYPMDFMILGRTPVRED